MGAFNESIKKFQERLEDYRTALLKDKFGKVQETVLDIVRYLAGSGCPASYITFDRFPQSKMPVVPTVPAYMTIGNTQVMVSKVNRRFSSFSLPFLLPLGGRGAFFFEGGQGEQGVPNLLQVLMLRLALSMPLHLCKFHMVDCDYGRSFVRFNSLPNPKIQKTLYGAEQINRLFADMENIMRETYSGEAGKYASLSEYNRANPQSAKPYNFIFIDDFPRSCSYQALEQLKSMISNGNAMNCGIYIFINFSKAQELSHDFDPAFFRDNCVHIMSQDDGTTSIVPQDVLAGLRHVNVMETGIPDNFDAAASLLDVEDENAEDTASGWNPDKKFYELPDEELWAGSSVSEINIPVGITDTGAPAVLHFTQVNAQNTALVVGSPGYGKSKFLHSMILNAALRYSPDELELYLLDFSGVEFDIYDRMHLPHARVIAPESEREFGINILEEIYNEGVRRERLCRENAVDNIAALRKKNDQLIVPRILVVIDEFQELFRKNNDALSRLACSHINHIIQKYRKFAINLVLSSQKVYEVKSNLSIDEIGNRIAFTCNSKDSALVGLDYVSVDLPGGCFIYNDNKGAKNSNVKARTFYIEGSDKKNVGSVAKAIDVINKVAQTHAFQKKETIVFRNRELPAFNPALMAQGSSLKEVRLYFGQSFAIRNSDIYVPLAGNSGDNVLVAGGDTSIAQEITMSAMMSALLSYGNKGDASFYVLNFLRPDNPMYNTLGAIKNYQAADITFADNTNAVTEILEMIHEEIEKRKGDNLREMKDIYIFIYAFETGQPFKPVKGSYANLVASGASKLLDDILFDGPVYHVYTILQVDNLLDLNRVSDKLLQYFNHRIALQMPTKDSNVVIKDVAASMLYIEGSEWTAYRGYYFNSSKNSLTKFRPYNSLISINNK